MGILEQNPKNRKTRTLETAPQEIEFHTYIQNTLSSSSIPYYLLKHRSLQSSCHGIPPLLIENCIEINRPIAVDGLEIHEYVRVSSICIDIIPLLVVHVGLQEEGIEILFLLVVPLGF